MIETESCEARLPSAYGEFKIRVFRASDGKEHVAVVKGDVSGGEGVLVRVHSECFTGDVLHSLKCDCRPQLEKSLARIESEGRGVLVYLKQEGRGIGLLNKINAYCLQEEGLDTFEANKKLGFPDDMRDYSLAAEILGILGVKSVRLLTNNPAKAEDLKRRGVDVVEQVPLPVKPNRFNKTYLEAKKKKKGHTFKHEGR